MIRKESAETQEYMLYHDREVVYDDKTLEEMGFVPSAVSDSAGWSEPLQGRVHVRQ